MPIFAVHYTYSDATIPGRDEHRPAHRAWLREQLDQGIVKSSGAYPDGSGALIIIESADLQSAHSLLGADPFAKEGVVDRVHVVEWKPVMGAFAD